MIGGNIFKGKSKYKELIFTTEITVGNDYFYNNKLKEEIWKSYINFQNIICREKTTIPHSNVEQNADVYGEKSVSFSKGSLNIKVQEDIPLQYHLHL